MPILSRAERRLTTTPEPPATTRRLRGRRLSTVAAAALVLLTTLGLAPPAQAQTDVWSATMTVGSWTRGGVTSVGFSRFGGSLSVTTFNLDGITYTIQSIALSSTALTLLFDSTLPGTDNSDLTFYAGSTSYALSAMTYSDEFDFDTYTTIDVTYTTTDIAALSWVENDTVTARLTKPAAASDTTAPVLPSATVNGDQLGLMTYDEALDEGSTPAPSAFTVLVADSRRTVTTVTGTLASAVEYESFLKNALGDVRCTPFGRGQGIGVSLVRYPPLHGVEEGRGVVLIAVVVVPEAGAADATPVAGMAEPPGRRRIQRRFAIAAQKSNGVALDRSALASRAGFVSDVQPQKRHGTDMVADSRFEFRLRQLDTGPVETEPPPRRRAWVAAYAPGWRQIDALLLRQRHADDQAEYRAQMVPAAVACPAAMLRQPFPQRAPAPGLQPMGSDTHDA